MSSWYAMRLKTVTWFTRIWGLKKNTSRSISRINDERTWFLEKNTALVQDLYEWPSYISTGGNCFLNYFNWSLYCTMIIKGVVYLSTFYFYWHKHNAPLALAITVHKNTTDSPHSDEGTAHNIKSSHHTSRSVISHDAGVVLGAAVVVAEMELLQPQHVCRHTTRTQVFECRFLQLHCKEIRFLFIHVFKNNYI